MFGRRKEPKWEELQPSADQVGFPHCDSLILHSPGACSFCDMHPDWQELRSSQGVAFSDTPEDVIEERRLVPCPSTYRRTAELRDRWGGNVPTRL
jgi:hypothetical protein